MNKYHLNGIFSNSGENSNRMVHPGGMFLKKGNTFRGIPFLAFTKVAGNFGTICPYLPATVLLSYIEGLNTVDADCSFYWRNVDAAAGKKSYRKFHSNGKRSYVSIFKFINQGHKKNNGNFPNISLLSCQVFRRCLEKWRWTLFFNVKAKLSVFSSTKFRWKIGEIRFNLTLKKKNK